MDGMILIPTGIGNGEETQKGIMNLFSGIGFIGSDKEKMILKGCS